MNAETFLENFSHIANAPNGISRLREIVLQLGVAGKLVLFDGGHEDVVDLVKRLDQARNDYVSSANVRTKGLLPPVHADEQTTEVPSYWHWIRLGNVCSKIGSGSTPRGGKKAYVNEGIPFLRSQNVGNEGLRLNDVAYIDDSTHEQMRNTHVFPNDVLLNITGASLGRCALVPSDLTTANVSQHVTIIRPLIPETRRFIQLLLLAPFGQAMIWGRQVGMAREGLSKKVLELFEIPLPGLEEQKRIVGKVDELMKLCDELEVQQQSRRRLFPMLSRACHARLAANPTPTNLAAIFTDPPTLSPDDMRKTILQFAVQGQLDCQSSDDKSVASLLATLRDRKEKMQQEVVGRKRTPITGHAPPQWADILPKAWELPLFDETLVISSGVTKGRNLTGRETIHLPYLGVANVQRWHVNLDHVKEIEVLKEDREKYRLLRGDIVMIEGGDWDKLGRAAIWNEEIEDCIHQNHVFRIRSPSEKHLLPEWVMLYANSPFGRRYFESCSKQTTNLASINMTQLRACPLPLPPTSEQRRIVDKVGLLMKLVDELETKKENASRIATAFALSAINSVSMQET